MKLQKDDARLLQYVLNEISAVDRQVVADAIKSQPEIATEIELLTGLYADISNLESQPKKLILSVARKQELFQKTIYKQPQAFAGWLFEFKKWRYAVGGLVAASFALMVFTHSLKNEVTDTVTAGRPKIQADSAIIPQEAITEKKSTALADPEIITEHDLEIPPSQAAASEQSASQQSAASDAKELSKFKDTASSNPSLTKLSDKQDVPALAAEREARQSIIPPAKKIAKDIQSYPENSIGTKGRAGGIMENSDSATIMKKSFADRSNKSKRFSTDGDAQFSLSKREGSVSPSEVKNEPTTKEFYILVSSRALEAEQIKFLQEKAKICLQQNRVDQSLKISFDLSLQTFEVINFKPAPSEIRFAECFQKSMVEYLPKTIKLVQIELKSVSK